MFVGITKLASMAGFWRAAAAFASALLAPAGMLAAEGEGRLEVEVRGLRSAEGTVAIALFDQQARFDARTGAIRRAYLTIAGREARWLVEGLPPGDYALLAYHDENGNSQLDFRPLGIPKEPFAVSNGATRLLGPPRFDSAKFALGTAPLTLTLELR
jgi:uncharacterized protein (DUF2141 family)